MAKLFYEGWKFPAIKVESPNMRYLKLIASPETTGYNKATVLFSHIPPGGTTGRHVHANSDEIIYFVGRGEGTVDGDKVKIETDSVMVAPMGVEHECRNTSETETLKLFCVFLPALEPSGALLELADKTNKYLKDS
jgi:mannose-6-phosphate isomerase-like protein (cupin superfamily)